MKKIENAKFAVLKNLNKPLKILNLKIPNCEKQQLLVKINYSFICGSQLNEMLEKGKR